MSDLSGYSDRELLEAQDGDGIAELLSRYMRTVFSCAARYAGSVKSADYEELVSDGMQGLLAAIKTYNADKGEFSSYVSVCVDNRMKSVVRRSLSRAARISDTEESLDEMERVPDPSPDPEELVIRREDSEMFMKNIEKELSELELRCIEGIVMGLSYSEIAALLKVDKKTVDNALSRGRAKLRRIYGL